VYFWSLEGGGRTEDGGRRREDGGVWREEGGGRRVFLRLEKQLA